MKFLLKCFSSVSYSLRPQLLSTQPKDKKPPPIVLKLRYSPHIKKLQVHALVRSRLKTPSTTPTIYISLTTPCMLAKWHKVKKPLSPIILSPYLKVIFSFLSPFSCTPPHLYIPNTHESSSTPYKMSNLVGFVSSLVTWALKSLLRGEMHLPF